eukprot:1192927-Rhodomonas_salina.1
MLSTRRLVCAATPAQRDGGMRWQVINLSREDYEGITQDGALCDDEGCLTCEVETPRRWARSLQRRGAMRCWRVQCFGAMRRWCGQCA